MKITINDWIEMAKKGGFICREGIQRLAYAKDREDVFRILCDSFSSDFLPDLMKRGVPVPLDVFREEYADFLDGKRVMAYPSGYTSKMYAGYEGDVTADTTIVSLIRCPKVSIAVPRNAYPRVVLSPGTEAWIAVPESSSLILDEWEGSEAHVSGNLFKVRRNRL